MEFKDYYRTMGVERDATQEEIKRAYRQLSRKFHPDVSKLPDAEIRFKELGEAYAVLKDVEKRSAYDQLGSNWKAGQDFQPPPDWVSGFDFSGGNGNATNNSGNSADDRAAAFSDFFDALYGHSAGSAGEKSGRNSRNPAFHARGADRHASVLIDLADSYAGATRIITLQTPEIDAQGRVAMHTHKLNVTIPRGVHAGQHIRLQGRGAPGMGDGSPGDLYLEVGFRPHAHYRVEQRNVSLDLPVSPWEAALGATIKVPTPSGTVEVKIPAGSEAGSKLRLKGRGIPGKPAGDLYAVLTIALPPAESEADKAAYLNMAGQFATFNPRVRLEP